MGQGLSRVHRHHHRSSVVVVSPEQPASAAALVIAADGSLREFFFPASSSSSSPVSVGDVLGGGNAEADRRVFLCSSDALYFGEDVPALGGGELLRPGQVYFVLPAAMLGRPLSTADMAKLAVRASEALLASTKAARPPRGRGVSRKVRVAPVRAENRRGGDDDDVDGEVNEKLNERTLGECVATAWASPPRHADKTAVAPARPSPKRSLATIEEDAE